MDNLDEITILTEMAEMMIEMPFGMRERYIQKKYIEELGKNASDEFRDKLEFIKGIKEQINPILIQKIRYFTLMGKK